MTPKILCAVALAAVLASAGTAGAERVTWNFAGTITEVRDPGVFPSIRVGNVFTGRFSYDETVLPYARWKAQGQDREQYGGHYDGSLALEFEASVNGHRFRIANFGGIDLTNSVRTEVPDGFMAAALSGGIPFGAKGTESLAAGGIMLSGRGESAALISDDLLRGLRLDLSSFETRRFYLAGMEPPVSFWHIEGELTSLSRVAEVPEPGALALLALAGAGMVAYRWRRQRAMTTKRSI